MKNLTCAVPRRRLVHHQFACPCLVLLAGVTHLGCESDNPIAQPTVETETVVLSCGDWVRGRFYFLEEQFHQFYNGYEMNVDWPAPHMIIPHRAFLALDLYRSAQPPDEGTALFLMNLDGTPANSGQAVRMVRESWNSEDPDATLRFDSALGIVDVGRPAAPGEWLAVGYATENQSAGAHNGTTNAQPGDTVRVLAPPQRSPDHQPYWNLELKNVYDVGWRADLTDFHLQLRCVPDSVTGLTIDGIDYPFTTLFCLNTCGGPAGEPPSVDPQWLDDERGLLWFPTIEPFTQGVNAHVYRWVGFWAFYGNLCTLKSWWHDPTWTDACGVIYQMSYDDPARPAAAAIYELVVTRSWLR